MNYDLNELFEYEHVIVRWMKTAGGRNQDNIIACIITDIYTSNIMHEYKTNFTY